MTASPNTCPARVLALAAFAVSALSAAATAQTTIENVRYDYAQVLRVEPVYPLSSTSPGRPACTSSASSASQFGSGRLSRVVGAVKGALNRTTAADRDCVLPSAFDVDYVYKDMKYRSRLVEDPGTRLRLRVSVMPSPMPASATR